MVGRVGSLRVDEDEAQSIGCTEGDLLRLGLVGL